jgi:hypothetical protein
MDNLKDDLEKLISLKSQVLETEIKLLKKMLQLCDNKPEIIKKSEIESEIDSDSDNDIEINKFTPEIEEWIKENIDRNSNKTIMFERLLELNYNYNLIKNRLNIDYKKPIINKLKLQNNKIIMTHWVGRFGNRMFQYLFGCAYAKKYNCIFYLYSKWEGNILFKENKYCKVIPLEYEFKNLEDYNSSTGDNVELVSFHDKNNLGKINIAFGDLNCMYFSHCFELFDDDLIKEIFTFKDEILNSEMYKYFYNKKGTYDVMHIRRGDISHINFNGAHSMISKDSYLRQLQNLKIDSNKIVVVSDDPKEQTENIWNKKSIGHMWTSPTGEHYQPEIFLDFLPDFLNIMFARTILRGNSSFSWWASCLGDGIIYSPLIKVKPLEFKNKFYLMDTDFVKGNYSHFMGHISEGAYMDIIFPNCTKYCGVYVNLDYIKYININPSKNKKIISFSLYDIDKEYSNKKNFFKGIFVNYHLAKKIYPDWIIRIYIPSKEKNHFIDMISNFKDIELILIDTNICLRALRFLPYDDKDVDIWISRDLDSIVNMREKVAVDDWNKNYSDKEFHILTDNVNHKMIHGGMIGFKNNINTTQPKNLLEFLINSSKNISKNNNYATDCIIAESFFYKEDNYIQHYGGGKKLENSTLFPVYERDSTIHVGEVVNMNILYDKLEIEKHYPILENFN